MHICFDTEFTGLVHNTSLISIGLIDPDGNCFYAELGDYDHAKAEADPWIMENVVKHLLFHDHYAVTPLGKGWCNSATVIKNGTTETTVYGNKRFVAEVLKEWLSKYESVVLWSDVLAWDWVLFCDLFGGAMKLPKNVSYIPFDLATALHMNEEDPDVSREGFAGEYLDFMSKLEPGSLLKQVQLTKHNALWDAVVIRSCLEKLSDDEYLSSLPETGDEES